MSLLTRVPTNVLGYGLAGSVGLNVILGFGTYHYHNLYYDFVATNKAAEEVAKAKKEVVEVKNETVVRETNEAVS